MILPAALVEVEQGEAGKIAGAHADGIGRVDRCRAREVLAVGRPVVLHADRPGNLALEGIEDRGAHRMLIDRAERVEIPVVVVPEAARLVAAAARALRRHRRRFIEGGVIDARARHQEVAHRGAFLFGRQRRLIVVDAERADRPGKIDLAALDRYPDQGAEQALAHGSERRPGGRVAPFGNDGSAMHDHHGGRANALRPLLRLRELALRPSGGLGVYTFPGRLRKTISGRSDLRCQQCTKDCDQPKSAKLHP